MIDNVIDQLQPPLEEHSDGWDGWIAVIAKDGQTSVYPLVGSQLKMVIALLTDSKGDQPYLDPEPFFIEVTAEILRVRYGPNKSSDQVGQVKIGDQYQVYNKVLGWYCIAPNEWIRAKHTKYVTF